MVSSAKTEERLKKLYDDGKDKQDRLAKLKKKLEKEQKKSKTNLNQSNKMLFDKVAKQFHDALSNLYHAENVSISNQHNKINFSQITKLFSALGCVSAETEKETANFKRERKLLFGIWEELKDSDGLVSVDELFIFLLATMRLYEFYIYKHFRKMNADGDRRQVLSEINTNLCESIEVPKHYGGLDTNSNYTLPFSGSSLVAQEYQMFFVNWSNNSQVNKRKKNLSNGQQFSFKPEINANSKQLVADYRQKLISNVQNDTFYRDYEKKCFTIDDLDMPDEVKKKKVSTKMSHVDLMVLKKKKQDKLNAILRENKVDPEAEEYTFKPKINKYKKETNSSVNRFDQLYQSGIAQLKNKRDKDRNELEVEKYGEECTFKPQINEVDYAVFNNGLSTGEDKDLEDFRHRMRVARMVAI